MSLDKVPIKVEMDLDLYNLYLESAKKIIKCKGCGGCDDASSSRDSYFSEDDSAYPIMDLVEKTDSKVVLAHVNLPMRKASKCFLCASFDENTKKCVDYAKRPFDCRIFPLAVDIEGELTLHYEYYAFDYCKAEIDWVELRKANDKIDNYFKGKMKHLKAFG